LQIWKLSRAAPSENKIKDTFSYCFFMPFVSRSTPRRNEKQISIYVSRAVLSHLLSEKRKKATSLKMDFKLRFYPSSPSFECNFLWVWNCNDARFEMKRRSLSFSFCRRKEEKLILNYISIHLFPFSIDAASNSVEGWKLCGEKVLLKF
jgi:hypothetical protein